MNASIYTVLSFSATTLLIQLEEQKADIESIMWDHFDKYREAKIELETLIQELQRELEKLKAICIINTEKIGYNLQVSHTYILT